MNKKFKIKFNSPTVLLFVGACLIVTLLGTFSNGIFIQKYFMTYHSSLLDLMTYVRLLTHILGHVDVSHFVGNAIYLLLLGPMLEEKYGSIVLVKIIVASALVTGVVNYIFFWNVGLCGASGVVFAFIILASFTEFEEGEVPLTFILVTLIFIGQQVYEGIMFDDNVSNITHIIGGFVGSFVGYKLNKQS